MGYAKPKEKKECDRVSGKSAARCSANHFVTAAGLPNDPLFSRQWHHGNINSVGAWEKVGQGISHRVVAIFDTGIAAHSDLLLTEGYNAISDKRIPPALSTDANGHGTHCGGIACAVRDNSTGVAGVSGCTLLPVRVLGDSGGGSLFHVIRGLDYVRENFHGVNIFSLSLGTRVNSPVFQRAVADAVRAGKIVVAAAGNAGKNIDVQPYYPCAYPGVVCVGATDSRNSRATLSNYGPRVDI